MKALLPKWRPSEGKRFHDVNPHPVRSAFRQITSFILPVTVLILVPWLIEDDFSVKQDGWSLARALLMLAGMKLLSATVYLFMTIGKGTLAPWFPTGKLVVTGPYRCVRNPMILGVMAILAGESLLLRSASLLAWLILFFFINQLFFLVYEEPSLEKRFGEEYRSYKKKVPRWIPDPRCLLRK